MGIIDSEWGMDEIDTDAEEKALEPLPKGTYVCTLHNVDIGSFGDTPTVNITWRVAHGEHKTRQMWQTIWCDQPKTTGQKKSFAINNRALGTYELAKKADTYQEMAENIMTALTPKVDSLFEVEVWGYRTSKTDKTYEQCSANGPFNESDVHPGVKNEAPTFDSNEEIPF